MPDDNVELDDDNEYGDIDQGEDFLDSDAEDAITDKEEDNNIPPVADEPKKYNGNKSFEKRIAKEVSKRKALEDKNYALNERLSGLEQRFDQTNVDNSMSNIDTRMESMRKKRKEMYDIGDIDPDVEDEWQDLRQEKRNAEYQKNQVANTPPSTPVHNIPDAQQSWMDDNSWYGDDEEKTTKANGVFKEMLDQGFNEQHPGTYKEFSKRMEPGAPPPVREPGAPPPASPTGNTPPPKGKGKLTNADFDMMTEMGMNPRNPEHRKQLLANRRST